MRRSIVSAVLAMAAGLSAPFAGALAAERSDSFIPPVVPGVEQSAESASPAGAVYIPGVGFRYVSPGARVYGWSSAYQARVYGYRARASRRACRERDWWGFDRCGRRGW
jgi:hypothetical protein